MTKEELIKQLDDIVPKKPKSEWSKYQRQIVDEAIKTLEQEPKTGHWIFAEGIKGKDNVEKCSRCGSHWREAVIYRTDTQEYLRTRLLYCPNCGSRNEVEV